MQNTCCLLTCKQRACLLHAARRVAAAIKEAGLDAHPQDYLQFFCLGKREGYETSPGLVSGLLLLLCGLL
jgi:hypothetical protein